MGVMGYRGIRVESSLWLGFLVFASPVLGFLRRLNASARSHLRLGRKEIQKPTQHRESDMFGQNFDMEVKGQQ
jgi:hypothetical protein